jgi:prophage regulatory protein
LNLEKNVKEKILRIREVCHKTGLAKSTLYAHVARGDFPAPLKIGPRAAGWRSDEIEAWLEKVTAMSREELTPKPTRKMSYAVRERGQSVPPMIAQALASRFAGDSFSLSGKPCLAYFKGLMDAGILEARAFHDVFAADKVIDFWFETEGPPPDSADSANLES